ncbi:MAG: hypothetical protein ACPGES_11590, partial [Coraliomargarita sp.]
MRFYRIWVIALGCVTGVSAQHVWNVGSFYIPNVSDEVELQEIRVGAQAESTYLSGALRVSGTSREDVFLLGSNGIACFYSMPGELTVERFEQLGPVTEQGLQQSRLIFNMITFNGFCRCIEGDTATLVPATAWSAIVLEKDEALLWS